ncbi:MAG: hypothetical protein IKO55_10120, partial [Kiritimatiellae bacterium]|nr:hypothetical protein [Kiritimatiellia bacterium]
EQAVAAGYNEPEHAKSDDDLKSVVDDPRFAKLCEVMGVIDWRWNSPKKPLSEGASPLLLSNDNVYYAFHDRSYQCILYTTNDCPVVYLNHHEAHDAVPCDGLIVPRFPEEAIARRRNIGAANMHFVDMRTWRLHPAVVASSSTYEEDRLNKTMSIPAAFGSYGRLARKEAIHYNLWNVLGVYTVASDYGFDGVDRFIGHFPCCIAHSGGAKEADKFVRLYRDIVRALPADMRGNASCAALNIIRHAQKCVTDEESFMSGIAQRPVLSFADIDAGKAIADAKAMGVGNSHVVPVPLIKEASLSSEVTAVTDLWVGPYDHPRLSATVYNECVVAVWGEKTGVIDVEMEGQEEGGFVWKVLQGDEKKVRIVPRQADAARVSIEVDYHEVFDVTLPNGKTVKSSRVDVGCFCVSRGRASVPAIVSVYFNPNETREYDANGRLVSIDYAKRQVDGWRPQLCAKGYWKDVFRYSEGGRLAGWTRFLPQEDGSVRTNEFTREGLVVMSRDALGRPKDVRRDMTMEWIQDFGGESFTGEEYSVHIAAKGIEYNELEYDPCGNPRFTTLAWQYEYSDDGDFTGKPSPKPTKPYACRPEMCARADFSPASGFDYPLVEQMMTGYAEFSNYKHGLPLGGNACGDLRVDSPLALKEKGLTPPKVLKKMEFCQWKPSTNDIWTVGIEDWTGFVSSNLHEQADGAYRIYSEKQKRFLSVKETYSLINDGNEHCAYKKLDKAYRRSAKRDLGDKRMVMTDGRPLRKEDLPEGVDMSMAIWEVTDDVYFCIQAFHDSGFAMRDFLFLRKSDDDLSTVWFRELPSRAFGNTVLAAFSGDAEAMNNLAVLLYAEVANSGRYKEAPVLDLLERSAAKGCKAARRNLGVFHENRGEKDEVGKR